ncbi:MAG: IMP cyclohydrolase [Dehalococcoidales bacterium]|nr:IMP cyclohydrolase [Dehalococcoidales bacterium]
MLNPNGPYPGRQLFLGLTVDRKPCLVYLVTGRSPESRQRKAIEIENTVRIGPVENVAYDPLRHYTAIKFDNDTGIAAVSNGIQTEAIYETYRLMFNVGSRAGKEYMDKLLEGANAEPDSLHTPRIAGVVMANRGKPLFIIGIKTLDAPAAAYPVAPDAGHLTGMSVYQGSLDNPEPASPTARLSWLEFIGSTSRDLAKSLYDISAADYKGDDIRVCSVAGIYSGGKWEIAIINKI